MHFKPKFRRTVALCLSAVLLTGAAGAAFNSSFAYTYTIGEGAQYTRLEGTNSGGYQKANYIEYKPNGTVSPVIAYAGDTVYGSKATITNAANYLKNQGQNVIGGINADFFVMGTGVPIGLVIKDGTLVSSDAWQYAVGFMADGTAMIGQPSSTMSIAGPSGTVWISYFNKTRSKAGIYLLDSNYDNTTHISSSGRSIVLERVDDTPVRVGGQVRMRVIAKGAGNSSTTITQNQMVLTIDDRTQATWVDYPIGEEVVLSVNAPDARWANVQYAVGGKNLVSNGTVSASGIDGGSSRAPRTAVGVKDDGTVLLYEIDGRQSSYSVGMTAAELGNELKSMGYNNVLCLDGGGSSAMNVRFPGQDGVEVVTKPSDGSLRACANYIFLVNRATPDGIARHVHMRPSYYYMIPGAETYFAAWASDSAYAAAPLPADISYTATSGSVDSAQQIYTAGEQTGTVTITGTSADGAVTGSHNFCVTKDVGKLELLSGDSAISSTSLRGGQTIDIDAKLYHQNMQMASKDALLTWTVSGDIGTVDENGVFTASEKPASGTLTCTYGALSASVNITVGLSDPPPMTNVADFEDEQPLSGSDALSLTRWTQYDQVARGTGALKVQYAIADAFDTLLTPRALTNDLTSLSLWAMADTEGLTLTAVFENAAGEEITVPLSSAVQNGAYQQLTAAIPEDAEALTGIQIHPGGNAEGTLYLDHIMMSKIALTNTDAPAITLTQAPATVSAGSSATVTARISMNNGTYVMRPENVTAYVDGVKSSAVYSAASGTISVATAPLTEGMHQVTIEAVDDAGNYARKSVAITAGSGATSSFADTATHWANGFINFAAKQGLLQGEAQNGVTNFNPQRNLRRSEFAVIMARYLQLDTSDAQALPFADADAIPSWAAGAVKACYTAGIMNGQLDTKTGESNFNPNANITRAEVMTVISKCLPRGYAVGTSSFTDSSSIPSWADTHVRYTVAAGLIGGYEDGTIRPLNSITRAEIAKILCGLY